MLRVQDHTAYLHIIWTCRLRGLSKPMNLQVKLSLHMKKHHGCRAGMWTLLGLRIAGIGLWAFYIVLRAGRAGL